jgi:hypothetical protein
VKASVPAHAYTTSVVMRVYRYQNRRWVYKYSYTSWIAPGTTVFYKSIRLTGPGYWRIATAHADYDHVPSQSAYRNITAR